MPARTTHSSVLTAVTLTALTFAVFAGSTHLASLAQAQSNTPPSGSSETTLTAIPPRLGDDNSLKAKPGEKIQASVRVRNSSNQTIQVRSQVSDFIVDENGETPIPVTDEEVSNRWSLASWVILSPEVQVLQPREIGTVTVIIEIPEDALPGGHYAMITHQPDGSGATEFNLEASSPESASLLQQRVGTLVYLMVEGPINEQAFIRDLTFPKFTEYGPVPFSFVVDNQSDIHVHPQVAVEIYDIFGRKVETIAVEGKNVFPFIGREFESQWDRVWGWGFYRAKVVMSYGTHGQVAMAMTSFWLLPITLVIGGILLLLAISAIFIAVRRHMKHRQGDDRKKVEILEKRLKELESDQFKRFDQ